MALIMASYKDLYDKVIAQNEEFQMIIRGLRDVIEGRVRPFSEIQQAFQERNALPHKSHECRDMGSMVLSGSCHPGMPSFPVISGDVLSMECAECHAVIGRFLVSSFIDEPINPDKPIPS
jgi:hypothetical protein